MLRGIDRRLRLADRRPRWQQPDRERIPRRDGFRRLVPRRAWRGVELRAAVVEPGEPHAGQRRRRVGQILGWLRKPVDEPEAFGGIKWRIEGERGDSPAVELGRQPVALVLARRLVTGADHEPVAHHHHEQPSIVADQAMEHLEERPEGQADRRMFGRVDRGTLHGPTEMHDRLARGIERRGAEVRGGTSGGRSRGGLGGLDVERGHGVPCHSEESARFATRVNAGRPAGRASTPGFSVRNGAGVVRSRIRTCGI